MTWVTWRLHRNQTLFAAAALLVLTAVLVPTGLHFSHAFDQALASCGSGAGCSYVTDSLFQGDGWIFDLVLLLTMVVPALFGVFWGAPVFGKELEEGTHKLVWTQGVTRRRWLAVSTAWVVLGAALWGGAMSALVTWWSGPINALQGLRFHPGHFDTQGIVPMAYAVFAVCLGMAAGAVLRRVLPAIAVTLGGYVGVRVLFDVVIRQHYMAPVTQATSPLKGVAQTGVWTLSDHLVDASGHTAKFGVLGQLCTSGGGPQIVGPQCLADHGYHMVSVYQPASHYWPFQGIEVGIFIAMAAVLAAVAAWRILRADA